MHTHPYMARHLGAPYTDWKAQARERIAERLSVSPTRGTLTPRGRHTTYSRYQPLPTAARRPVDRPWPVEIAGCA